MEILIIGCGAAGAAAAIAAAQAGHRVTVIDRNRKPLKKLGVTGNGRGNLLNLSDLRYYGDTAFAHQVLEAMPPKEVAVFLEDCGITLAEEDEGRVYPAANLASVAVDGLLHRMERLGVELLPCALAECIQPGKNGFSVLVTITEYAPDQVKANGKVKKGEAVAQRQLTLKADRVIVAAGGAAAPAHGTDGTAYGLLTALGHTLRPVKPALCALLTDAKPLKGLSGKRVRAGLALRAADGCLLHESNGEALFAEDGVSGIAAMQLARFVQPGCTLHMDLRYSLMGSENTDAAAWLRKRRQRLCEQRTAGTGSEPVSVAELFTGCAHPALQAAIERMAGLSSKEPASDAAIQQLAKAIEDFALPVTGTRDFDQAQVTAGGMDTAQFDPQTMESRLVPGLYAAGEMLDVDGDCGGYNLMFAFAGGLLAGRANASR
ncbi:MAG: NAD(P)/FAD-dependent oxidoreductase [Clostridia bacterium]|nr:NAD(P)/FAD-dependent oxidoreductase [Clostridia bacterium]